MPLAALAEIVAELSLREALRLVEESSNVTLPNPVPQSNHIKERPVVSRAGSESVCRLRRQETAQLQVLHAVARLEVEFSHLHSQRLAGH